MTNTEAIKVLNSYCSERYLADTSLQEACSVAVEALREQALSEEDYIELRNRFGTVVESVVRDMVSGKGERWEQAQADGEYISKEKAIIQLSWDLSEVKLPRIKESLDKLLSVAIPSAEPTLDSIRESIEEYVCNVETDTARAQKMLNAWRAIEYDEPLPTTEPKTGHWRYVDYKNARCSNCNYIQTTKGLDKTMHCNIHKAIYKYCPNCGARMERSE